MDAVTAANKISDALDSMVAMLRRLNATTVQTPTLPGGLGAGGLAGTAGAVDLDRVRAEFRMRLQDPQEIAALKKRLGL